MSEGLGVREETVAGGHDIPPSDVIGLGGAVHWRSEKMSQNGHVQRDC